MGKLTWILAIAFICTSIALTIIAARKSADSSVLDRVGGSAPAAAEPDPDTPVLDSDSLLPPSGDDNAPLVPKAD